MRPIRRYGAAAAIGLSIALALPALGPALGDDRPSAERVEDARHRMEKGQELFQQGKYADAMAEFEAAYQAHPFGAFLFNAALCAEKSGDRQRAIAHYKTYLDKNPNASDAAEIKATIARLEAELTTVPDGGETVPATPGATTGTIRSLVVIESEPPGAPLTIWERTIPTAPKFRADAADNPGWRKVLTGARTPHDLPLGVGHYHVVIDAFQDYKRSETSMSVAPGHVYRFKANLSQGEFLGLLRVRSNVETARIYIDDPPPHKTAPAGRGNAEALLTSGEHQVWVEAVGHEPVTKKVVIQHGDAAQVDVTLSRVGYGFLRIDGNSDEIEVEVDGQPHGVYRSTGAPLRIQLPAGRHRVEIDASGKKAYEGDIDVPRGQEVAVHATLIDTYGRGKAVVAALGAVGLGVGGFFLLREADDRKAAGEDDALFRYAGIGGLAGAGALGAASIFLFLYDPNPDSLVKLDKPEEFQDDAHKTGVRVVVPAVGANGGGLVLGGAF